MCIPFRPVTGKTDEEIGKSQFTCKCFAFVCDGACLGWQMAFHREPLIEPEYTQITSNLEVRLLVVCPYKAGASFGADIGIPVRY